jgi:hypothetical protein
MATQIYGYNIVEQLRSTNPQRYVYLIEKDGINYILKRHPVTESETKYSSKNVIWQEIDVCKSINNLPENQLKYFMKMIEYHVSYSTHILSNKMSNQPTFFIDIILEHKGTPVSNIIDDMPLVEKYNLLAQVIHIVNILAKNGYEHLDLHADNITYIKNKHNNYNYYLIDY